MNKFTVVSVHGVPGAMKDLMGSTVEAEDAVEAFTKMAGVPPSFESVISPPLIDGRAWNWSSADGSACLVVTKLD